MKISGHWYLRTGDDNENNNDYDDKNDYIIYFKLTVLYFRSSNIIPVWDKNWEKETKKAKKVMMMMMMMMMMIIIIMMMIRSSQSWPRWSSASEESSSGPLSSTWSTPSCSTSHLRSSTSSSGRSLSGWLTRWRFSSNYFLLYLRIVLVMLGIPPTTTQP